jgi:Ferritin-like
MQASWDDWGRGYKPAPRSVTADGNLDPEGDPGSGEPRSPFPDPLAGRPAHVQIDRAATRAQAVKALRALAAQGEAPHLKEDETGEPSHFERFAQIYKDFKKIETGELSIKPTHDVRPNPTTRVDFHNLHPDGTTYIGTAHEELAAHYLAQLFNQRYRLLLTYLGHTFRLARTQPTHQPNLRGMVMHRVFGEMYNLKAIAGLLVRLPIGCGGCAGPPFEMPYSLDLPQADCDIWRLHHDLLVNSYHTCREVFRVAKGIPAVRQQIASIGGDVYLRSLMDIDSQTQKWIAKVMAGEA